MALPKKNRLKKRKDFESVFQSSTTSKGRFLLIKVAKKTTSPDPKIGFIISSKVVKKAVDRNRIRRILSQEIQQSLNKIKSDTVILLLKRPPAPKSSEKEELTKDLKSLLYL